MKDKILALLVAKFAGVRKDGLARLAQALSLQAADETEAGALVEKLTIEKVNEFVTDYRKDVDKEVSDANKTYEGNLKKKYDFVEKKDPEPGKDPKPSDPNDIAAIVAAAVKTAVEPLQKKIETFEGSRTSESRLQQLQGKFKDKNLPESYTAKMVKDFGRMSFESDEAFTEYLTEVETDITAFNQELADNGMSKQSRPIFGQKNTEGVSAAVTSYISQKAEGNKALTGKEV